MQVKRQQLKLDMEQQLVPSQERSMSMLCIVNLLFNLYAEYIMLGWMKHNLESRLQGEMSITLDMHMTPSLWHKVEN